MTSFARVMAASVILGSVLAVPVRADDGSATSSPATSNAVERLRILLNLCRPSPSVTAAYTLVVESTPSEEMRAATKDFAQKTGRRIREQRAETTTSSRLFQYVDECERWDIKPAQEEAPDKDPLKLRPIQVSTVILRDRGEIYNMLGSPDPGYGAISSKVEPPSLDFTESALGLRLPDERDLLNANQLDDLTVASNADGTITAAGRRRRGGKVYIRFDPNLGGAITSLRLEADEKDPHATCLDVGCSDFIPGGGRRFPRQLTAELWTTKGSGAPYRYYKVTQTFSEWKTNAPRNVSELQILWPEDSQVLDTRINVEIPVTSKGGTILTDAKIAEFLAARTADAERDAADVAEARRAGGATKQAK